MPPTYTPLRYPGGKAKFGPFVADVLRTNRLTDCTFAEPYAGGGGAALFLLFRGYAKRIRLNDIDPAITSFWNAVLSKTEAFARAIETTPLTVAEWDRQRAIYVAGRRGFSLGFAFFYLNRTNRSGIMNGGIIGGRAQQGEWLIDARFNRTDLADRVRAIGAMRRSISVTNNDALDFLADTATEGVGRQLVYLDPPYYAKGRELYTNFYTPEDHRLIAERMREFPLPWLMTYDDCEEIRSLYRKFRVRESTLSYSAREVRRGREVVILAPRLRVPPTPEQPTRGRRGFEIA